MLALLTKEYTSTCGIEVLKHGRKWSASIKYSCKRLIYHPRFPSEVLCEIVTPSIILCEAKLAFTSVLSTALGVISSAVVEDLPDICSELSHRAVKSVLGFLDYVQKAHLLVFFHICPVVRYFLTVHLMLQLEDVKPFSKWLLLEWTSDLTTSIITGMKAWHELGMAEVMSS